MSGFKSLNFLESKLVLFSLFLMEKSNESCQEEFPDIKNTLIFLWYGFMISLKGKKCLLNDSFFNRRENDKFSSIFFPKKRQATKRLREFPKLIILGNLIKNEEKPMRSFKLFI